MNICLRTRLRDLVRFRLLGANLEMAHVVRILIMPAQPHFVKSDRSRGGALLIFADSRDLGTEI